MKEVKRGVVFAVIIAGAAFAIAVLAGCAT